MTDITRKQIGEGAPLVLLHGWGWHGGVWGEEFLGSLIQDKVQVTPVDLPGHGGTKPLLPFSLDSVAGEIAQQLHQPVTLLGWSLGGLIAMKLARDWPHLVKQLVLLNSTPCYGQRDDWRCAMTREELKAFNKNLELDRQRTLVRFLGLQMPEGKIDRRELQALREQMFARGEPDHQTLQEAMQLLMQTDYRELAKDIDQPVLLIHGNGDQLIPQEAAQWLAQNLPDSRLQIMENAGHLVFRTRAREVASSINQFRQDHPAIP